MTTNLVQPVPQSFLGLSMNVNEMEEFTEVPAFTNIINNILSTNASGNGPFVLRLGGTEIDSSYWQGDQGLVLPMYQDSNMTPYTLTPTWLNSLAGVVQDTGSKVILNVNAVAHSPQMATDFIRAAQSALPASSLMAIAIGNEPNLYTSPSNGVAESEPWVRGLTPAQYASIFSSYAEALRANFPGVPLAGPESTGSTTNWTSQLLQSDAGQVGMVTSHIYPLNACEPAGAAGYPTIVRYLQDSLVQETTAGLQSLLNLATSLKLPYRLTELGSGTCNGVAGVNDTFATSLWVLNQLFSFMSAGLDGVNVHLRTDEPNSAITTDGNSVQPQPLLYGMAAFANALEPNDVLTQVTGSIQPNVSVWSVYGSDGWHLALVNDTSSTQLVELNVPATGTMTITPLLSSSPSSVNASFGGQTITSDGNWSGPLNVIDSEPSGGVYPVVLPPTSAAIADVAAAPGVSISSTPLRDKVAKRKPQKKKAKAKKAKKPTPKRRARAGS